MEWISVKDRLPDEEDSYLTYMMDNGCSYNNVIQRFFIKPRILKGIYGDTHSNWELVKWDDYVVTHWMPLPKPPEQKENLEDNTVHHFVHHLEQMRQFIYYPREFTEEEHDEYFEEVREFCQENPRLVKGFSEKFFPIIYLTPKQCLDLDQGFPN